MSVPATLPAPENVYQALSRATSDPISKIDGAHSTLSLMLIVLRNPDNVTDDVLNDLFNAVDLVLHTLDEAQGELEEFLSNVPTS